VRIGVPVTRTAYTPEAFAYRHHLESRGWEVLLAEQHEIDLARLDLKIIFMGARPAWKRTTCPEIHEYQSLSLPPGARLKNLIKSSVSGRPAGRIFLNAAVKAELGLRDGVPHIYRDMGVDHAIFLTRKIESSRTFDLVYCGSIHGRTGIVQAIQKLAQLGLSVLVVGEVSHEHRSAMEKSGRVEFTGRVERREIPGMFARARIGLNYTPDIYPFSLQASTKTIEYCAAGLGVVSTRGAWVEHFCRSRSGRFLWLDDVKSAEDLHRFKFDIPDVADLEWEALLTSTHFDTFLRQFIA
jgi:hypothetical protein